MGERFQWRRYLLAAPFFAGLAALWLAPMIQGLLLSLHSDTLYGASEYVGLDNYRRLLDDDRYWKALRNTGSFTLASALLSICFALGIAASLHRIRRPLKGVLAFVFMIPGLCPPLVMAFLFLLVFHGQAGLLNQWLVIPLGLPPINWLADPDFVLAALVLQSVWRWSGFMAFFLLSAMEALPQYTLEAAQLDGAGARQRFFRITLPLIFPTIIFCLIYIAIDCVAQFAGSYVLLGGSGGVLDAGLLIVSYTYQHAFAFGQFGSAAAIALSALPFLFGLVALLAYLPRRWWNCDEA